MSYESLIEATKFHAANENNWCGEALAEYKHEVYKTIEDNNVKTILDYGCGKAKFHKILFNNKQVPGSPMNVTIEGYDPAVPMYSKKPEKQYDMALCVDVMEHVQEDKVEEVLKDLFSLGKFVFLTITCYPAQQILLNGKNAHYTIKEPSWWDEKLLPYDGRYHIFYQVEPQRSKIVRNPDPVGEDKNAK
jgi:2-polyprenyl-3-methyl-5-hydroxy-6-metoxy-1,4-benzoquinol methylase